MNSLSKAELESMRLSGKILSAALRAVVEAVRQGQRSTGRLDEIAATKIQELGGQAPFFGYQGFPGHICISVNDEVVHGIPTPKKMLADGDVVGFDLGVSVDGLHTDMATSLVLGSNPTGQIIIEVTRQALAVGLKVVRDGATTGDLGAAIQAYVESSGFNVVRDLVGHGVGRELHEEPSLPNFGKPGTGTPLRAGMTLAIEPMVTAGRYEVTTDDDGWTVRTADGSLAAHEERTVLVTKTGFELLTPWEAG